MLKIATSVVLSMLVVACDIRATRGMEISAEMSSDNTHCFFSPNLGFNVSFDVPPGQPVPTRVRTGQPLPTGDGAVMVFNFPGEEEIRLREVPCIVRRN